MSFLHQSFDVALKSPGTNQKQTFVNKVFRTSSFFIVLLSVYLFLINFDLITVRLWSDFY